MTTTAAEKMIKMSTTVIMIMEVVRMAVITLTANRLIIPSLK